MSVLLALWVIGVLCAAVVGLCVWQFGHAGGDSDGMAFGARLVLLCWAWPLYVLVLVTIKIRDACNR